MASRISDLLRTTVPEPCFDRPFVCDGLPENCTVLVIGENPAVQLGVNWWEFWDDESGFDRNKFQILIGERKPTKTRKALDRLLDPLRREGVGCLDTNVFRNETPGGRRGGGQNGEVSNHEVLKILMAMPQLKAVVAHGRFARDFIAGQLPHLSIRSFTEKHFISVSYDRIDDIRSEILSCG